MNGSLHSADSKHNLEVEHREVSAAIQHRHNIDEEDERAIAFRLARMADPGVSMGSWRGIQFLLIALVICMCSGDNG